MIGLSWADEVQLILSLPDSGIRSVKDLKGRRFGLPHWTGAQIDFTRAQAIRGLENALRLEGLEVKDVELVDFIRAAPSAMKRPSASPVSGLRRQPPWRAEPGAHRAAAR